MAELYKDKYKTTSDRLQGFDYGQEGAYFITICTANHNYEFGKVKDDKMILSDFGKIVKSEWYLSQEMRKEISFGEFCVMPNHIHGIVFIGKPKLADNGKFVFNHSDNYKNRFGPQKKNLSTFISQFKGACTRKIIKARNIAFAWQSNYYDHIIRNQSEIDQNRKLYPNKSEELGKR
jgi:putative transposase